jgi:hypothetical protein
MHVHYPLPIVGQNSPSLPDGMPDPAHYEDCGEANVSCVVLVARGAFVSPGCIREMLGKRATNGYTDAGDLARAARFFGIPAESNPATAAEARTLLTGAHGENRIYSVLGTWIFPGLGHWVVGGAASAAGLYVMDPWHAKHTLLAWEEFDRLYEGSLVRY